MVDLPSQPLAEFDAEFERIALETGGLTYGLPGIGVRQKLLLCLANDVCRGHLGLAFRMHVMAALAHGVAPADLFATIRFIAPYAGYPAAADALARLGAVGTELGVELHAEAPSTPSESVAPRTNDLRTTDEWFHGFVESRITRAWQETGLDAKEKCYLAITADIAHQTLGSSFHRHIGEAVNSGVSPDELRDVVRFHSEFATYKAENALAVLDDIFDDIFDDMIDDVFDDLPPVGAER